jgi:hypothetical protein
MELVVREKIFVEPVAVAGMVELWVKIQLAEVEVLVMYILPQLLLIIHLVAY